MLAGGDSSFAGDWGDLMNRRVWKSGLIGSVVAFTVLLKPQAAPAADGGPFAAGAQITVARFGELETSEVGVGGRASWQGPGWIAAEGEVNFYPADIPDRRTAVSRNRLEGLFGITAGPQLNRWRPFARLRPGFVRVGSSPEPLACILIFPPPTSCALAEGETLFTIDLGAGVELSTTGRTFVRFDVGDRMLRFRGPAQDVNRQVHEDNFIRHELRVAFGAGWRF
jgi:hypothetical protein